MVGLGGYLDAPRVRVTPILDIKPAEGRWERVKQALLNLHGDYKYPRAAKFA